MVNLPLISRVFPDICKTSHAMPPPKNPIFIKRSHEKSQTSVKPRLNFVLKIVEKVIANRICSYLERNDLSNQYQSAYTQMYSTETVLLKVENVDGDLRPLPFTYILLWILDIYTVNKLE